MRASRLITALRITILLAASSIQLVAVLYMFEDLGDVADWGDYLWGCTLITTLWVTVQFTFSNRNL